ncbi:MAG TPA: ABC transporter permease [Thermodesulfobacteriota bacterium]|nr:ABC transporter permease [Thermodesulfobacteriota bacterium]
MFLLKLLLRNAFRHKLRTLLTILSLTIAISAFGLLRTFISAWYAGVEASSASRLVTRNSISLIFPLPLSYKEKIRQIEGVKQVSWGTWFGGIYINEKNFFANFAVDPKTYLNLYSEFLLAPDQREAFLRDRKSFVAGRKLAERFKWRIGDIVTLRGTIFPGNWEFVLRGIYRGRDETVDETTFFFHWDYLNETLKKTAPVRTDQVGWYMIGITHPDRATAVALAIDKTFKNSLAETITESEKAFQLSFISMSEAIITAIQMVSIVIIIIIIAVAANTMSMTARERIGEYAIFKTLGYRGWRIGMMILGESMFITLLGGALGMALTFPIARACGKILSAFFPIFKVPDEIFVMDLAAVLVVGLSAAIVPTWRASRIRIAEGLRRIG